MKPQRLSFSTRFGTFSRITSRPYQFAVVCLGRGLEWYDRQVVLRPEAHRWFAQERAAEASRQVEGGGQGLGFTITLEQAEELKAASAAEGYVEVEIVPLTSSKPVRTSLKHAAGIDFES